MVWIPDHAKRLIEWVVRNHDLFGRLCRAVGEKQNASFGDKNFSPTSIPRYRGALGTLDALARIKELQLCSQTQAIRVARLVWEADAGSVPTLRWALPQAKRV